MINHAGVVVFKATEIDADDEIPAPFDNKRAVVIQYSAQKSESNISRFD